MGQAAVEHVNPIRGARTGQHHQRARAASRAADPRSIQDSVRIAGYGIINKRFGGKMGLSNAGKIPALTGFGAPIAGLGAFWAGSGPTAPDRRNTGHIRPGPPQGGSAPMRRSAEPRTRAAVRAAVRCWADARTGGVCEIVFPSSRLSVELLRHRGRAHVRIRSKRARGGAARAGGGGWGSKCSTIKRGNGGGSGDGDSTGCPRGRKHIAITGKSFQIGRERGAVYRSRGPRRC